MEEEKLHIEKYIDEYPFRQYILEDKSQYKRAKDLGYNDPNDLFLVGESGGFLMDIEVGDKFVNTHLLHEMADFYNRICYCNIFFNIIFSINYFSTIIIYYNYS